MSDLLNIGASAVRAFQSAMTAVGENVSNASTPGYTRRTVTLAQVSASASTAIYYNNAGGFSGVKVESVSRAWNDYQATSARTASSDAGRASARLTWLTNTQTALADDSSGVGQSATSIFNAGDTLAGDPSSTSNRQAFLSAIDQTASAFRSTASQLAAVSDGIAGAAQTGVDTVNHALDALDKINASLRATQAGTSAQADLLDQRDQALDTIAANAAVDVSLSADGSATVKLTNSGLTLASGTGVGTASARMSLQTAANGRLSVLATSNGQTQQAGDIGGGLGGLVESAGVASDRRTSLDALAANFSTALNNWQAQGQTAAGTAGQPLLTGSSAATLTLATSDPSAVAAASSTAANGNLLALSALRGTDGVEASWNGMVTDQGQLVSSATAESTAATARSTTANSALDQSSSVDLDTEAADLLRYQQAYNGAAKVIQTAKETMQAILDII